MKVKFRDSRLKTGLVSLEHCALALAGFYLLWLSFEMAFRAFMFPLEIEQRESSFFAHLLALREGINLYTYDRVAFANQCLGIGDPVLKHWIWTLIPFLDSHQITRVFVLLLPFACVVTACFFSKSWVRGLFAGSALYVLLANTTRYFFLHGRSDPLAIILLLVGASLGLVAIQAKQRTSFFAALGGLIAAFLFLSSWRIFPALGALASVYFVEYIFKQPKISEAIRKLALPAGVAFVSSIGLVFYFYVAGGPLEYYRHSFGFYTEASGWGVSGSMTFVEGYEAFFRHLWPMSLWILVALGAFVYGQLRNPTTRKIFSLGWLPMFLLLAFVLGLAHSKNSNGGGLYYFAPLLVFLWVTFVRKFFNQPRSLGFNTVLVVVTLSGLNLAQIRNQSSVLRNATSEAWAFRKQASVLDAESPIVSEDQFFYKKSLEGITLDMGDTVYPIYKSGYFGPNFNERVQAYYEELRNSPPRYIASGDFHSEKLGQLLASSYKVKLEAPPHFFAIGNGQGRTKIYERK